MITLLGVCIPRLLFSCKGTSVLGVWKNRADDYTRGYMNSRAIIEPNGNIFWPPPTKFRSTCPVDVTYFPFDDQTCKLKLGSWIYDGLQPNVTNNYQATNAHQLFNSTTSSLSHEIQRRLLQRHSKYGQPNQPPIPNDTHIPFDLYAGHRYALSTESLINIEDNYKLLLNLSRAKSCNRIANNLADNRTRGTGAANITVPGSTTVSGATYDRLLQAHEELLDIICRYLLWESELKGAESDVIHEWRLLALFIDRILFWIFFIITFCSSVMFLVVIPIKQRGLPNFLYR
ncbi:unnamed protein product [Oppiella nova]|uniref:Neurotransmitter-gated ion-channel ligand-binding domain-containing protein n=1 Tax=Oppiella nova TaxID=334625 RepID=A0A7R9LTL2_9ACAR|nr:unnamed protein product [Oppiella nova]CAG2166859.1 unnamed protein product [Oppiella nova]